MKDDAVMELFKEVDTDDSGKIDINEFIKFFEIWEDYEKMNRYVNRQK
jgi:Ca2+-binding EF-hand superfamily protein